MKAWIKQDPKQVKKVGPEKASWYVEWVDPDGKKCCKSCGPGKKGHHNAVKLRDKTAAQLLTGTYQSETTKTWAQFREDYEARVVEGMATRTREEVKAALNHFQRIVNPKKMGVLKTATIDTFIAKRRQEPGKKKRSLVSPATVNKELRHLRAALAVAHEWAYLPTIPKFRMEKVPKKLATYMTGEHFADIYQACADARFPADMPYQAADWWRGLLTFGYMTGWRISEMLALRREDLDLEKGTATTRARDNKAKRDEKVKLHPIVVAHLKKLASFSDFVFPWPHYKTTLYQEFATLQEKAKVKLACSKDHEHTRYCHVYGFHDLRRAFATMNADRLTPDALQALMRHQSYSTTQRYINIARQMDEAVDGLHVPDVLKGKLG